MDIKSIRDQFPALKQKVYGRDIVYLDNAATSHKPQSVIDLINKMNGGINANIHRAVHKLSSEATDLYEQGRDAVREFIGAQSRENIIFTSGTTASINLVASSFGDKFVNKGDSIIVSEAEHHSNIVPWQILCEKKGAVLKVIPVDEDGSIRIDLFEKMLDPKVKIVAVTQISNVLGVVNPVKEIINLAHRYDIPVLVDGAQGVVHQKIDVQEMDCDFYVFSGHKIYAATGTGILYGKERWLELMPPYMGGGDMVDTVTFNKTTYASLPLKFEAGTPNFIGAATYKPALDFAAKVNTPEVVRYEEELTKQIAKLLLEIDGLRVYGSGNKKIPLFSFTIEGVHHSDVATLLDKMGIAVRSGLMCAEPLMTRYGQTGMIRASFAAYNTKEEGEIFIEGLKKAINMLK